MFVKCNLLNIVGYVLSIVLRFVVDIVSISISVFR